MCAIFSDFPLMINLTFLHLKGFVFWPFAIYSTIWITVLLQVSIKMGKVWSLALSVDYSFLYEFHGRCFFLCSDSDVYIGYLPLAHVLELCAGISSQSLLNTPCNENTDVLLLYYSFLHFTLRTIPWEKIPGASIKTPGV